MIDIGNAQIIGKRDNQEDYFASTEINNGMLSVVADGMGGYEGGEVASTLSVKTFIDFFKTSFTPESIGPLLIEAVHFANSKLEEEKKHNPSLDEMGCTFVAIYITDSTLYWVSVGDSILYRYANAKLIRLNANHSIAGDYQMEVDAGRMTQKEADIKPNRHALTSALTGYEIPHIEQSQIQINEEDRFIIASDGIHTLDDKQIEHLASREANNQVLADSIVKLVEKKNLDNQDNTTLIIFQSKEEVDKNINESSQSNKTMIFSIIIILLLGVIGFLIYENYTDKLKEGLTTVDTNDTTAIVDKDLNVSDLNTSSSILDTNKSQIINEKTKKENNETNK